MTIIYSQIAMIRKIFIFHVTEKFILSENSNFTEVYRYFSSNFVNRKSLRGRVESIEN